MGSGRASCAGAFAVRVVIDHRERGSGAAASLEATPGIEARYAALRTGDYLIEDRVLFERKTIADFAASVIDGRLFQQAGRLAACAVPGVVVMEGGPRELAATGMSREALQGALISLTIIFGIPVLRALDGRETAKLMLYAADQIDRVRGGWIANAGYRPKGRRRQQLRVLQALPGIGPKRAEALLATFGSIREIMAADSEALAAVHGMGPMTAAKIENVLREIPDGGISGTRPG